MKKPGRCFTDSTVKCPFCGFSTDRYSTNPACGGCHVEFYENREGGITFDTRRKTKTGQDYAFARAFSGMRIGQLEEQDEGLKGGDAL